MTALELDDQGPKLTRAKLDAYAQKHRLSLPPALIAFLLKHNGGRLADSYVAPVGDGTDTAGITFFGAFDREPEDGQTDISERASVVDNRPAKWLTPFAYDAFGNLFAVSTREQDLGSVWFWDHEADKSRLVNPDFDGFLESIRYEEPEPEPSKKSDLSALLKTEPLESIAKRLPSALAAKSSYTRYCVASSNRLDVLRWMLDNDLSAGMLVTCAEQGNLEFVEELLARGVDPDEANEEGTTPLILVSKYGHREIAERLLDAGADPSHEDELEETPLSTAQYNEHAEIVKLLKARLAKHAPKSKAAPKATPQPKAAPKGKPKPKAKPKTKPAKKKAAR